jgi:hypothetical protein
MPVMESTPTGRVKVTSVATPDELTLPEPSDVAPFEKATVPSGEPRGGGATVAVSVMGCPCPAGLGEAVAVVVVEVSRPMPDSVTIWVPALSTSVTEPGIEPATFGENSMPRTQLSPGLTGLLVLQVVSAPPKS